VVSFRRRSCATVYESTPTTWLCGSVATASSLSQGAAHERREPPEGGPRTAPQRSYGTVRRERRGLPFQAQGVGRCADDLRAVTTLSSRSARAARSTNKGRRVRHDSDHRLNELGGVSFATHADVPPHGAESAVDRIRRALLQDAIDTRDVDVSAREEVPGTAGLLHRAVAAIIFGERGKGKTTVALTVGMSAAAAGEKVLYLDRENGGPLTRERTDAMLDANPCWGDPLDDGRFVGRHYPTLSPEWRGEDFGEAIAGSGFKVVIYDSTREMLAQLGLDPDSERDLSRFHSQLVTPLRRHGIAVALLDNVGHADKQRPKGSATKLDAAEQAYKVTTTERFSAAQPGRIRIECIRSRYGDEGREWSMQLGDGVWGLPAASTPGPGLTRARDVAKDREDMRLACTAVLGAQGPQGRDALIAAARNRGIAGRNEKLREWLAAFASDPSSGIERSKADGYRLATVSRGPSVVGHVGATLYASQAGPLAPSLEGAGGDGPCPGPDPNQAGD
jgi:hypothetical protein